MMRAGFKGDLYPVNPGEREIMGLRCYSRMSDIPGELQLVVMCAPVRVLGSFIQDLKERASVRGDVEAVVCTTAGFAETRDPEAIERQETLVRACRESSVRLMGPNCIGVIDTRTGMDTTFLKGTEYRNGGISFVSQSGALGAWLVQAWSTHASPVGFSKFVSLGNTADVEVVEVLEYLAQDATTRVIGMYLEGVKDARLLVETASRVARHKPVLVMKTGRTQQGVEAARSHTGAMAGRDQVWDAAFRQHGLVRASTVEEMLDTLRAFDRLPEPETNSIFVLTHAGGPGVYAVDFFSSWEGVEMARVSEATRKELKEGLPPHASVCHPEGHVDMTASATPEQFARAVNLTLKDDGVGGTTLLFFPTAHLGAEEVVDAILDKLEMPLKKPFLPALMCGKWVREGRRLLEEAGIPTFNNPERAGAAFLNMVRRVATRTATQRERPGACPVPPGAQAVIDAVRRQGRRDLTEPESATLLEAYGVPVAPWGLARDAMQAVEIASSLGYPVALKVVSPEIPHKTDAGVLRLNIATHDGLLEAYESIVSRARAVGSDIHGVLVQSMVKGTLEVILGGLRDTSFGPVVMVGAGGVFAELQKDVAFRLAPLLAEEVLEMLREVKSLALLNGFRGMPPGDREALGRAIEAVSHLVACPEILEIDVNPLMVLEKGQGVKAVDALITLT